MRESEAHKSSGIIGYLKNPETGEMMMLRFPPGVFELRLEMQMISRTAVVYATLTHGEDDPEYDVRLRMDTRRPEKEVPSPDDTWSPRFVPRSTPPAPPGVSVFEAPRGPVDRSASVFAEVNPQRPSLPAPQATQAPPAPQAPPAAAVGAPAGAPGQAPGGEVPGAVAGAGAAATGAGEGSPAAHVPASPQTSGKTGAKGAAKSRG